MNKKATVAVFIILPLLTIILSIFIGRLSVSPIEVLRILWEKVSDAGMSTDVQQTAVVWEIRLPRSIAAAIVGAALAVSGAAFQGLFFNPLVSSGILGVSSGAGFGAALAIVVFGQTPYIIMFAFFFGCLAVILSYMSARIYKSTPTIMLILGGTVVSSIFSALVSLIKYVADPYNELPAIVFWLMGSLASLDTATLWYASIPIIIGMLGLFVLRWRLNILSMGDREARSLGINVSLNKGLVIAFATLATAGAVCIAGIIGWVGLIIPHICRMLFGSDNKILVPASISLGAVFMILVDIVARTITGSEIPLGIITAIIGGPFFIYLLKKTKGGSW